MTLIDIIRSLEVAQAAIGASLDTVKALVGSIEPISTPAPGGPVDTNKWLAAEIVKEAKRRTPRGLSAKRQERIRKSGKTREQLDHKNKLQRVWRKKKKNGDRIAPEVRARAAKEGWAARRAKKAGEQGGGPVNFADYVTTVLKAAGRPLDVEELATEMSKLGWTTSSSNIVGLFGVMMPQVKGVRKTAPRTWEYKNGNGK